MIISHHRETVSKQATNPEEADRLRQEAAILQQVPHPGVVQFVGMGDVLDTRAVDGRCLADVDHLSPEEVAGLGATLATTLADLHDLGIVHGAIEPSHVLLDRSGHPILCSLGRRQATAADDVLALTQLLESFSPGPWLPRSRPWRRPTARRVAAACAAVKGATLPDGGAHDALTDGPPTSSAPQPPAAPGYDAMTGGQPTSSASRVRGVVGAGLLLLAGVALVAVGPSLGRSHGTGCPSVDLGCGPLPRPDGMLVTGAGRFAVGQPGDQVVVGRWTCGPALPALLRPGRGEVWLWDAWPAAGVDLRSRSVGQVAGARSLRVLPGPSGCDRLQIVRHPGHPVVLPPPARPN